MKRTMRTEEQYIGILRERDVRFLAVDMPGANELTVGIMAQVAQAEREEISRHAKEALVFAKA